MRPDQHESSDAVRLGKVSRAGMVARHLREGNKAAEIVENLHRENLNAADEAKAIIRLEELMPIIRAQTKKTADANKESSKAQKNERDAAAGISATNVAENKKRGRPSGKVTGKNRDLADQHGISEMQVRRAKRRAKAMGDTPEEQIAALTRIAAQPQFDKPSAVDALAAMPVAASPAGRRREHTQPPLALARMPLGLDSAASRFSPQNVRAHHRQSRAQRTHDLSHT